MYYVQEDPTESSRGRNNTSDKQEGEEAEEEEVVDMTQEFEGDLEDLPKEDDDKSISGGQCL